MIHARRDGGTFGLSIGEFSIKNKPVITWKIASGLGYIGHRLQHSLITPIVPNLQRLPKSFPSEHLKILKAKALTYSNSRELYNLLMAFDPVEAQTKNWDAYSCQYSPGSVMKLFEKHFLTF